MVGSVTSDWLTTVVLNHASIHSDAAVASGAGLFKQTGALTATEDELRGVRVDIRTQW